MLPMTPAAPCVVAPQLPPESCWALPPQAAAPASAPQSRAVLSWKDPQGSWSPAPGPVQSPSIPPGMLHVGFVGGNARRDLQRGLELSIPAHLPLRKGWILRPWAQ